MKVVELLKLGAEMLKLMSENEVNRDDWRFVPMYEAFQEMRLKGVKYREAVRMLAEEWNRGYTWSNPHRRRSITLIGRATDWPQFFDTVMHETGHIRDEIMKAYDIMNYGEPPAYTQGEIGRQMAPMIRRIACPCCGKDMI